jgi:hypothetical protein
MKSYGSLQELEHLLICGGNTNKIIDGLYSSTKTAGKFYGYCDLDLETRVSVNLI